MKVRMLVQTCHNGPKNPGDITDVPKATADRWIKNGIAEAIDDAKRPARRAPSDAGGEYGPLVDSTDTNRS